MDDFRTTAYHTLSSVMHLPERNLTDWAKTSLKQDTVWDISDPIGTLTGRDAVIEGLILPLRRAIPHVRRRDEIFIGGENRRAVGGTWVSALTHYVGTFQAPLCGIPATDQLVFLRSGEFYRIEDGHQISQARLILDFLDLMRQAGCCPIPAGPGAEILFPSPATHDGVLPNHDADMGPRSLDLVEAMLSDLMVFDPETMGSRGQTGADGYWHPDMMWYGPGGIGSNYRWDGFVKDHRTDFLTAFPDRIGGDHYCRIGDGAYAAISGWPSMTMTHQGPYLGVPATGRALTLRVMDFYRCADGKLIENWVCLDYTHLLRQMGKDPFTLI